MVPSLLAIGIFFVFTRVIWFVTPNEKRNKQVIGLPIHHITLLWGLAFVIPDLTKGVMGMAFKELAQCDPHSYPVRIEEICMVIQIFVFMLFTVWTARFMQMANHWLIPGEAEAKNWRKLGWATVASSAIMTVRLIWSVVEADAKADKKSQGFVKQHEWTFWLFSVFPCLLIYTIFQVENPGKYFPRDYTRFKFDTKKLEKQKMESSWPLTISNPIQTPNDKEVEVITTEILPSPSHHPGHRL